MSSSAKAIKTCVKYDTSLISFIDIHKMYKRAHPENFLLYKHALSLYKLYWTDVPSTEFIALNLNSIFTSRQTKFITSHDNNRRVGLNALANRLHYVNDRVPLIQLNKTFSSYKYFCKNEFLKL